MLFLISTFHEISRRTVEMSHLLGFDIRACKYLLEVLPGHLTCLTLVPSCFSVKNTQWLLIVCRCRFKDAGWCPERGGQPPRLNYASVGPLLGEKLLSDDRSCLPGRAVWGFHEQMYAECLAQGLALGRTPRVEAAIWNSGLVCLYSFKMNSFKNM